MPAAVILHPAAALAGGKVTVPLNVFQPLPPTWDTVAIGAGNCPVPPAQVYVGCRIRSWGNEPLCRPLNVTLYLAAPRGRFQRGPWNVAVRPVDCRLRSARS